MKEKIELKDLSNWMKFAAISGVVWGFIFLGLAFLYIVGSVFG
jgi:uncharacterized membrane protein